MFASTRGFGRLIGNCMLYAVCNAGRKSSDFYVSNLSTSPFYISYKFSVIYNEIYCNY